MPPPTTTTKFAFVSLTPDGRGGTSAGGSSRDVIRSHCMIGRNKKEGSRRSKR